MSIDLIKDRLEKGGSIHPVLGGTNLTAFQCRTLLDYIKYLERSLSSFWDKEVMMLQNSDRNEQS